MNDNSAIIFALCSHIGEDERIRPLEPREWSALAKRLMEKKLEPKALLGLNGPALREALEADDAAAERVQRLLDREASLAFALSRLQDAGIFVVTRADAPYPKRLRAALGNTCPPLFYGAGELPLLEAPAVGYVGSRAAAEEDLRFTRETVAKTVGRGFLVVADTESSRSVSARTRLQMVPFPAAEGPDTTNNNPAINVLRYSVLSTGLSPSRLATVSGCMPERMM